MSDTAEPVIVVVDDCPEILTAVRRILKLVPCRVVTACDAASALQAATTSKPELLILDQVLPGGGGFDLLEQMRLSGVSAPAIIMSGYPTIASATKLINEPTCCYLAKPFPKEALLTAVQNLLHHHDRSASGSRNPRNVA